ncbi:MAG: signal peptide peptidase SppA, partial [Candidatus Electrothrix sp. AUS1_2]|nr:signal peptide peptidase SppA [Candidatus Electrothrix sp. AUS1_2]
VEKIAEGRVWDGATAQKLGLVDELGGLEDAVAAAAELVGLPADRAYYLEEEKNPAELILQRLEGAMAPDPQSFFSKQLMRGLAGQHAFPSAFLPAGDPRNMYSHCLLPLSVQ